MALREQARGRHRAGRASVSVELPAQRTSHRWTSGGDRRIPAPRRAVEPVAVPAPRRASGLGARGEAARIAAAGLAGARLASALLTRATGEPRPEPGVVETPVDPWARRGMPVRYRPLPRRRRMVGVWVLLAVLLVAAVGVIPSAVRTSDVEDITGGGGGGAVAPAPAEFTDSLPDGRAQTAIDAALAQVGVPYQWGGDGPSAGDQGFDCSGLTGYAYAAAGIMLPRTAHAQYAAGPHVPADAPLQPGDLVFYGTPAAVHHVGIYLGDGRMVNAPTYDRPVQVSYYRWRGDDYLGATRPAASGPRSTGLLAFTLSPTLDGVWPRSFAAPKAAGPVERVQPSASLPPEGVTAAAARAAAEGASAPAVPARLPTTGWSTGAWAPPAAEHEAAVAPGPATTPAVDAWVHRVAAVVDPPAQPPAAVPEAPAADTPAPPRATTPHRLAAAPLDTPAADPIAEPRVGTLTLPSGDLPLFAARLDDTGVPLPPPPGTAALLDEGGAQLVLLPGPDLIPLDEALTVTVDGTEPRTRTVVEAQTLTREQFAAHIRTLPRDEFEVAAPAPDGTWVVAELE